MVDTYFVCNFYFFFFTLLIINIPGLLINLLHLYIKNKETHAFFNNNNNLHLLLQVVVVVLVLVLPVGVVQLQHLNLSVLPQHRVLVDLIVPEANKPRVVVVNNNNHYLLVLQHRRSMILKIHLLKAH